MGVAGRQAKIGRAVHKPLMTLAYPKIGPSAVSMLGYHFGIKPTQILQHELQVCFDNFFIGKTEIHVRKKLVEIKGTTEQFLNGREVIEKSMLRVDTKLRKNCELNAKKNSVKN